MKSEKENATFEPLCKAVEKVIEGVRRTRQRQVEQDMVQEIQRAMSSAANTDSPHHEERKSIGKIR